MSKGIRSSTNGGETDLAQSFGLSWAQFLLNLLIGGLILTFINISALWHYFDTKLLINQTNGLSPMHASWFDKLAQSRIPQIIFWIFLGCTIYLIFWMLRNFATNVRNDLLASHFVRPVSYDQKDFWLPILLRKIFFVVSSIVLIGLIFAAVKLVNALAYLCASAVTLFRPAHSLEEIVSSWLAVAILIQLLLIMVRVTSHSWRSINDGL